MEKQIETQDQNFSVYSAFTAADGDDLLLLITGCGAIQKPE